MQRVTEILELTVVVERRRVLAVEGEPLEEFDFLFSGVGAEDRVAEEGFESGLDGEGAWGGAFHELETLAVAGRETRVQRNLHAERFQVDVPGFDERVDVGNAVVDRDVEDVGVEKFENHDTRLMIAALAKAGDRAQPLFAPQFLAGGVFGDIEQFLGDEALQFAEWLLLKNCAYAAGVSRLAFAESQLAEGIEQWTRWASDPLFEVFLALKECEIRELTGREPEEDFDAGVNARAVGGGGDFFAGEKL